MSELRDFRLGTKSTNHRGKICKLDKQNFTFLYFKRHHKECEKFILVRMIITKKMKLTNAGRMQRKKTLYTTGGNIN